MTATLTVAHGDKTVSFQSVADVVNPNTGGLLPFKKYALATGVNLDDKDEKKLARASYNRLMGEFGRQVKTAAAVALQDDRFVGKKFKFARNSDGELTGYDISLRAPSKAQTKATGSSAKAQLDAALAQLAEMKAKLAAAGIEIAE